MQDTNCARTTHLQSYMMIMALRQWTAVGLLDQHDNTEKKCIRDFDRTQNWSRLTWGVTWVTVRKNKQNVSIPTKMHSPPLEGNFCETGHSTWL
jgi:hypothetical protein